MIFKVNIALLNCFLVLAGMAQDQKPLLLSGPSNWTFERFALPPVFAPDFPFKGSEELRFSPGMFNKDAPDYFTYAFVSQLANRTAITQKEIQQYLLAYFKGLCSSTAKDRKLVVDTNRIAVAIVPGKTMPGQILYEATLQVFGVFADGAPVTLQMEIKVLAGRQQLFLVFIASPKIKTDPVWAQLHQIQQTFMIPAP